MKNETTIKQIDLYIRGKLGEDEIRLLWIEIMKEPELLEYLEIETGLFHLFKSEKNGTVDEPDISYTGTSKWTS